MSLLDFFVLWAIFALAGLPLVDWAFQEDDDEDDWQEGSP